MFSQTKLTPGEDVHNFYELTEEARGWGSWAFPCDGSLSRKVFLFWPSNGLQIALLEGVSIEKERARHGTIRCGMTC